MGYFQLPLFIALGISWFLFTAFLSGKTSVGFDGCNGGSNLGDEFCNTVSDIAWMKNSNKLCSHTAKRILPIVLIPQPPVFGFLLY